jgi:molecular chaperone DnaJ
LKGKGIKQLNSTITGNQYIHFNVVIPKDVSANQRKMMEEFAKEERQPTRDQSSSSFFKKMREMFSSGPQG